MKVDETSISIIKHLREGRKSFKKIADALGLSENTVRTRVNKLLDERIMEVSGLVDPGAIPRHRAVIVGVKLKTMDLVKKGEEFSRLTGVVSVSVVTGRYDLMLVVFLKEGYDLLEFYTEEVSRIEDVQSVETFVVYKNYNLMVPYIL
jgi:Lrp/AsnC family transcriptional regulator for asnA, asnC and gidA